MSLVQTLRSRRTQGINVAREIYWIIGGFVCHAQ